MKQQFVVTHGYTHLQGVKNLDRPSVDQHLGILCYYENIRTSKYCGHNILTETVFVTQLSTYEGISAWRIVWVTKKLTFPNSELPRHT